MRIQVYLSEKKDQEIIKYVQAKDENFSKYVRKLIKQDMSNNYPLTKEEIIKIIEGYTEKSKIVKEKVTVKGLFD